MSFVYPRVRHDSKLKTRDARLRLSAWMDTRAKRIKSLVCQNPKTGKIMTAGPAMVDAMDPLSIYRAAATDTGYKPLYIIRVKRWK